MAEDAVMVRTVNDRGGRRHRADPDGASLGGGLAAVPISDMPLSELVVAWSQGRAGPLVRSFAVVTPQVFTAGGPLHR